MGSQHGEKKRGLFGTLRRTSASSAGATTADFLQRRSCLRARTMTHSPISPLLASATLVAQYPPALTVPPSTCRAPPAALLQKFYRARMHPTLGLASSRSFATTFQARNNQQKAVFWLSCRWCFSSSERHSYFTALFPSAECLYLCEDWGAHTYRPLTYFCRLAHGCC